MFKYLLILGILFYLFYKVTSFFFRAGAASQQMRQQQKQRDVNPQPKKAKGPGAVKGGDYVDYEEVK